MVVNDVKPGLAAQPHTGREASDSYQHSAREGPECPPAWGFLAAGCTQVIRNDGRSEWVFGAGKSAAVDHLMVASPGVLLESVKPTAAAASSTPSAARRVTAYADTFTIRSTAHAGLGAYATRNIKSGERILAEVPLIECTIRKGEKTDIAAIIAELDTSGREEFWSLCQSPMYGTTKGAVGVWQSNALPQGSPLQAAADSLAGVKTSETSGGCYAAVPLQS